MKLRLCLQLREGGDGLSNEVMAERSPFCVVCWIIVLAVTDDEHLQEQQCQSSCNVYWLYTSTLDKANHNSFSSGDRYGPNRYRAICASAL